MNELKLIFWETTRACNLDCLHCRAQAEQIRSPMELNTEEIKKFIEEVASFSKPILVFSGGEPLLRPDLYELIQYADKWGLKPSLATNATLINEKAANRLKESGIRIVAVSIYGASADSHNRFCGKAGAFEKSKEGIKYIKKARIDLQINTTLTRKNLDELEAIGNFALEQGAVSYHIFFLVPTGRGKSIEGDGISSEGYERAFERLYDLHLRLPLQVKATCAPHYYRIFYQSGREDKINHRFDTGGFNSFTKGCLVGQGVCFISYCGEVFGCGYLPIRAGNIREESFRTIWFESELFKILRDDAKLKGKCGFCEFKNVCGGCRARAYAKTGDYLEEEPDCVYQPLSVKS